MSEKHDGFVKVKLYPHNAEAVRVEQKRRTPPPPSFTAIANTAIGIGLKVMSKKPAK